MNLLTLFGIAISLAMDAFSVCIAAGVNIKEISGRHYFRLSFHFGLFQFLMPIIGYHFGLLIEKIISKYGHWVVLAVLSFIGIKMIYQSFSDDKENNDKNDPSKGMTLILLSVATSIDAAAIGLSMATIKLPIVLPAIIIGLTCIIFSILGIVIGKKIGMVIGKWAERLGGLILIAIGVKVLLEHICIGF